MAKYIAHSSIDERGKISGGVAGDQTKKEVCIRTWYSKPWNYVFRIDDEKVRTQFANNMIDLANNDMCGYDQNGRNSLLKEAIKVDFDFSKIEGKCESDCSSAVTTCLLGAIYTVLGKEAYEQAYKVLFAGGNCATTRTLRPRLLKLTMVTVKMYNSSSYTSSTSNAVFGDIYIKEGSHVVVYINDGKKKTADKAPTKPVTPIKQKEDKTKVESAKYKDKTLAGTYVTTSDLNLRSSAGKKTNNRILTLTKGTRVNNYGFYNLVGDVKWLLIQVTIKGVKYTGYCSSKYLTKK